MKQDYQYVYHLLQILIRTCSQLLSFLIMVNSVALSHIWYRIITNYLEDQDIYNLCMAFPIFKDMFPRCKLTCHIYEINNSWICRFCSLRFENWFVFRLHCCKSINFNTYHSLPEFAVKTMSGNYKLTIKSQHDSWAENNPLCCSICEAEIYGNLQVLRQHQYECHGKPK